MFVPTLRALVIAVAAGYLILVDRRSPSMILWTFALMAFALLLVEIVEGAGRGYEQPRAGALVAGAVHDPGAELAGADGAPGAADATSDRGPA